MTQLFFMPRDGAERIRQAGRVDYGIMSPILLYFAHLKGWSFEPTDVSPAVIDNLRRLGARFFVTTRWNGLKNVRPEAAAFLDMYQDVGIDGAPADTRLIDLRLRKSP